MSKPTFHILINPNSADSRVFCNGVDISSAVKSVKISQFAQSIPKLEIEIVGFSFTAEMQAAIGVEWKGEPVLTSLEQRPTEVKGTPKEVEDYHRDDVYTNF